MKAHAATDVTGFGILGHAQNLVECQEDELDFVIDKLPILDKIASADDGIGRMFQLVKVKLICLFLIFKIIFRDILLKHQAAFF